MDQKTAVKKITALLLAAVLLTACGEAKKSQPSAPGHSASGGADGLEEAPVLDYEVPVMLPGILPNRIGYEAASRKIAVIRGSSLPDAFRIVDIESGEIVYTGKPQNTEYNAEADEYSGYVDFSELEKEGRYYIECDIVGRSYDFEIRGNMTEKLTEEGLERLVRLHKEFGAEDFGDACECVSLLLLSYELYGGVYDGEGGRTGAEPSVIATIRLYADWLLSMQDPKTGAAVLDGESRMEESAWLSAVLAKFSYTYQKYDSVYATACLQAADRAWRFVEKSGEPVSTEVLFFAAAELYRATGQYEYRTTAERLGKELSEDPDDTALFFGTLTYASTKRTVDVGLCGRLLTALLGRAEEISEESKSNRYMVAGSLARDTLAGILWDAVVVSAIDYVITNSEYATLIENYYNYLAGTNEEAVCLVYTEREDGQYIGAECAKIAEYIMLLSEIRSHEQEE